MKPKPPQVFDNPSDRALVLGYLAGLGAALCLVLARALETSLGPGLAPLAANAAGLALALPALLWSSFWRVLSAVGALIFALSHSLSAREQLSALLSGAEGASALPVMRAFGATLMAILFAACALYPSLKNARASHNFHARFNAVLGVTLALVACVEVNYLCSQRRRTWDWTRGGLYTLSAESKALVAKLERPLILHLFMSRDGDQSALLESLAKQYQETLGARLELRFHDPYRDRLGFMQEVERLGVIGRDSASLSCLVFELGRFEAAPAATGGGERRWVLERSEQIGASDLFESRRGRTGASASVFHGEQLMTNAILELQGQQKPKLYLLQGHRSPKLSDRADPKGYGRLASLLRARYFDLEPLELGGDAQVPDDCRVLIIAGPQTPLTRSEQQAIDAYVKAGGALLCLVEFLPAGTDGLRSSPLAPTLRSVGLVASDHLVVGRSLVETGQGLSARPEVRRLELRAFDSSHPVTRPLEGGQVIASFARALTLGEVAGRHTTMLLAGGGAEAGLVAVRRPRDFEARGFALDPDEDLLEGFGLAASSELAAPGARGRGRVIALGDADIAANSQLERGENLELLLNALGWLKGREDASIGRAKKRPSYALRDLGPASKVILQVGALFLLPALPLSLAFLMFLLRRR